MTQCKHVTTLNQHFDLSKITLCWYQQKGIIRSTLVGNYISPRILKYSDNLISDMVNFYIVDDNISDDDGYIKVTFNGNDNNDKINYHESDYNNESVDDRISYSSFMVICNELL